MKMVPPSRAPVASPMMENSASGLDARHSSIYVNNGPRPQIADEWHRILTGRQSPEPINNKLRQIYSQVLDEKLPADMLELLEQLDSKTLEA